MKTIIPSAGTPIGCKDILNGLSAFISGDINSFENTIKHFTGKRFCYFMNSGTTALLLALNALKQLSNRTEVILPAYTAPSLILPIKEAGLKPMLCDISLETFNADLALLSESVSNKTLAIIPVHMFGLACDMVKIEGIAAEKGAFVIEDAASSLGANIDNKVTGAFGDIGFYSFNRGKNLSTCSGGCIVTDREDIALLIENELKSLPALSNKSKIKIILKTIALALAVRPFFFTLLHSVISKFKYKSLHESFDSFEYTNFQAGVGHSLFKRANTIFVERQNKGLFLHKSLSGIKGIRLPEIMNGTTPVFNQFPLVLNDPGKRDLLFDEINKRNIECTILYPDPVHKAHDLGYDLSNDPFANASYMAERLLLIPTHSFVTMEKLKEIVEVIKSN